VLAERGAARCRPCLLDRVRPRALELHDLGPVHVAAPAERDHVRLALAPVGQRRRPLLRAPRLVGRLAGQDHAAVDEAADDRRNLPRRDRDHRLVQQPEALDDAPAQDQEVPMSLDGEGEQIAVTEALGDRRRVRRGRRGGLELAHRLMPERERHEQVSLLDAVLAHLLDEPLRAPEPAGPAAHLATQHQVHADPECGPRREQRRAAVEVQVMSPLEVAQVLVLAPEHVRRRRDELDVLGRRRIRTGERRVGLQPRAARASRPGAFEMLGLHGAERTSGRRDRRPPVDRHGAGR
jgi:hypothetical protein